MENKETIKMYEERIKQLEKENAEFKKSYVKETKNDNVIRIKERDTFKVYLEYSDRTKKLDENGNQLYIEFDLEDIELPLRYNKAEFLIRKAQQDLKFDLMIIDKRQDVKGKYLLSKNDEDRIKAKNKCYKTMEEAMDLFLGKGGVQKIFDDTRYETMFDDLAEMLEPIMPQLEQNVKDITDKIKNKYKKEDKDVLKNE